MVILLSIGLIFTLQTAWGHLWPTNRPDSRQQVHIEEKKSVGANLLCSDDGNVRINTAFTEQPSNGTNPLQAVPSVCPEAIWAYSRVIGHQVPRASDLAPDCRYQPSPRATLLCPEVEALPPCP